MKNAFVKALSFAVATVAFGAQAEDLVVEKGNPVTVTEDVSYDKVYLHDNLTIDGGGVSKTLTLANNKGNDSVFVATNAGEDVTITLKNGGRMVQAAGQGGYLKIGGNGTVGSGGFARLRLEGRHKTGNDTFRMLYFVVDSGATVPTGDDADNTVLYLGKGPSDALGAAFWTHGVQNWNVNPIRVQFDGGNLNSTDGGGDYWFSSSSGLKSTIILESCNGNPISFDHGGHTQKTLYNAKGKLVVEGNGDVYIVPGGDAADKAFDYYTIIGGAAENYDWTNFRGNYTIKSGRLLVQGVNVLPCHANCGNIRSMSVNSYFDVQQNNAVNGIDFLGAITNSHASNVATVTLGQHKDGMLKATAISSKVLFKQEGNHSITVGVPSVPSYELAGGTLSVATDIKFGKLTLAAGTTFKIDGCKARVDPRNFTDNGATINCVNGGELLFEAVGDIGAVMDRLPTCEYVKTGAGTLVMNQRKAFASGNLTVREGTVALSGYGYGNEWWRVKVMRAVGGWYPFLSCTGLFADGEHVPVTENDTYEYVSLENTTTLSRGQVSFVEKTAAVEGNVRYETDLAGQAVAGNPYTTYYKDVSYLLKSRGDQACCFSRYTKEGSWSGLTKNFPAVITLRRAEGDNVPLTGFSIRQPWNASNIGLATRYTCAWTVENSDDGANWTVVQDHGTATAREEQLGKYGTDPWGRWFGGNGVTEEVTDKTSEDFEKCLAPLPFDTIPVGNMVQAKGMAAAVNVQVDAGATLDCSMVDGKQEIGLLTVDLTKGGGTLKSVKLAETGTLKLVNPPADFSKNGYVVPLTFMDSTTTGALTGWTVKIGERELPNKVEWNENGKLKILPLGLILKLQ